jgi:curli biogenesis system outer membrane secretion channel CsgG
LELFAKGENMMDRFIKIMAVMLVATLALTTAAWCNPRVAVMDFENKAQYGGWRIGSGAADILTTELVKVGKFDMFERKNLQSVIKEQDLGASGRMDPSTAARIGKIIGVNYIITGAVTEYGQSRAGGGGGGVNVGKVGYQSTVDVRMVDAVTGKIVFADSGSGSKSSLQVRVFGFGGGESFNEKHATEAMREAIVQLSKKIAALDLKKATAAPGDDTSAGKALIADVYNNIITLNKGKNAGLATGQTLTAKRKDRVIKDPNTGKVLRVRYRTVGTIKLTTVEESFAEGSVVSGSGFQVGDMVE